MVFDDEPPAWVPGQVIDQNEAGLHLVQFDNFTVTQGWYDLGDELRRGLLRWDDNRSDESAKKRMKPTVVKEEI